MGRIRPPQEPRQVRAFPKQAHEGVPASLVLMLVPHPEWHRTQADPLPVPEDDPERRLEYVRGLLLLMAARGEIRIPIVTPRAPEECRAEPDELIERRNMQPCVPEAGLVVVVIERQIDADGPRQA